MKGSVGVSQGVGRCLYVWHGHWRAVCRHTAIKYTVRLTVDNTYFHNQITKNNWTLPLHLLKMFGFCTPP